MLALFNQLGPYLIQPKVQDFKQNLNTIQLKNNIIFLESPVGVGYSEKQDQSQKWDDESTATDIHSFLKQFWKVYPEYQQNDFYVAGEGYAAVYIGRLV